MKRLAFWWWKVRLYWHWFNLDNDTKNTLYSRGLSPKERIEKERKRRGL